MSTNLKFITGFSAEAHIKPAMDAQWHAALCSKESGVFYYGTKFATAINQANSTIVISDGIGQIQGRLFLIDSGLAETISYPNVPPEEGLTRIDTIVLHWGTSTTIVNGEEVTINTCEFEYKKNPLSNGQPQTFEEESAELNLGDTDAFLAMWRVSWTSNGIGSITPAFDYIYGEEMLRPLHISLLSVSSLPVTITDARIIEPMQTRDGFFYLSNSNAMTDDWQLTTADGSAVLSGPISGTTDIGMWLVIPR